MTNSGDLSNASGETRQQPSATPRNCQIQGVELHRLVRLGDLPREQWPNQLPSGTQYRDLFAQEWITDYAGWLTERAMEDLAWTDDPTGAMSIRIPLTNVRPLATPPLTPQDDAQK